MGLIFKKSSAQPQFSGTPTISGTLEVGQTLSVTDGGLSGQATGAVLYEWESYDQNGENPLLLSTAGNSYELTGNELGRRMLARVYGTNPAGTNFRNSEMTAAVADPNLSTTPAFTSAPAITGTAEVGQTLTESGHVGVNYTTTVYTWYRYSSIGDGTGGGTASPIGLNQNTYTILGADADAGGYIGITVKLIDANGEFAEQKSPVTTALQYPSSESPVFTSAASVEIDEYAAGTNAGEYLVCKATVVGATSPPEFTWTVADNSDGLTGGTVRTVVDSTPIQPLPFTQPNTYWSFLWLSDEHTPSDVGRYATCAVKAVNSVTGPTGVTSQANVAGPVGAIVGTPLDQTDFNGGYLAITSPGTYYLTENVTADLSGVAVLAQNVTFNGNGKTLTWNNVPAVYMTNPGFESGATGWDFTNSGNGGSPGAGDEGDGTYVTTAAVTLPLTTPPDYTTLSAEQYAFNYRLAREGTRALRWSSVASNNNGGDRAEFWVESSEFTVTADVWWSLKWCVGTDNGNFAPDSFVAIYKDGVKICEKRYYGGTLATSGINNNYQVSKGPREGDILFKSDAVTPTYKIRVGIHSGSWATNSVWFDDFMLTPARCAGFLIGQDNLGNYNETYSGTHYADLAIATIGHPTPADIDGTGTAGTNTVIKNLTISQGAGRSFFGYSIRGDYVKVSHVNATVTGPCCGNLRNWAKTSLMTCEVSDCHFDADVPRVQPERQLWWGANIFQVGPDNRSQSAESLIQRTTIINQVAPGIVCKGEYGGVVTVRGCTIKSKASFTNQFSIMTRNSPGFIEIHDNVIDNTGSYRGRGIQLELAYSGNVHHNSISIVPSSWNPEYNGYTYAEWAVSMESTAAGGDVNVYDNTINVTASGPWLKYRPDAAAIRAKGLYVGGKQSVFGNTINLTAGDQGMAAAVWADSSRILGFSFYSNTVNTNSSCFGGVRWTTADMWGNTINYTSPENSVRVLPVFATPTTSAAPIVDVAIADAIFNTRASELFLAGVPRLYDDEGTGGAASKSRYRLMWTVVFDTGAGGDTITVKDRTGAFVPLGEEVLCSGDAATNVITALEPHLFEAGDKVVCRELVGASGLSAGTIYYIIEPTQDTFKVSATLGGAAVALTTAMTAAFFGLAELSTGASGTATCRLASTTHAGLNSTITDHNSAPGYTANKNGGAFSSIGSITAPTTVNL